MLNDDIHWEHGVTSEMWEIAVDYVEYLYNHLANEQGIAPADFLLGLHLCVTNL